MIYFIMCSIIAFATYQFVFPILRDAKDSGARNQYIDNPVVVLSLITIAAFILAPGALVSLLFPEVKEYVAQQLSLAFNSED